MNPAWRKEISLVSKPWLITLLLAIVPTWMIERNMFGKLDPDAYWAPAAWLGAGLVFPALASFGLEMTLGTFSTMLSQPQERRRVWRMKLAVLLGAAFLALAAAGGSFALRFGAGDQLRDLLLAGILLTVVAISGGWWATLLLRQVAGAFWFALCVPIVLTLLAVGCGAGTGFIAAALGAYAVGGMIWAGHLFDQAQDLQWVGGIVSLPSWRSAVVKEKSWRPVAALVGKELALQQPSFILAAALAFVHVLDLLVRRFGVGYLSFHTQLRMALEVVFLLWWLIPGIVGCIAVAEERKLGTWEGQLCGPASRRTQFAVKLGITLALALIFGAVAPLAIEYAGQMAGVTGLETEWVVHNHSTGLALTVPVTALIIGLTAFYMSTLARNMLHALGATIGALAILAGMLQLAMNPLFWDGRPIWGMPFALKVGAPLTVFLIVALAWKNFGHLHFGARVWRRNILWLLGAWALTISADAMVFNRVWESFLPLEPRHEWSEHGRRLAPGSKIVSEMWRQAIITPEGKLSQERTEFPDEHTALHIPWRVAGTNWADVALTREGSYALQKDGSLWDVTDQDKPPQPFLPESRWRCLAGENSVCAAIRSDGTLWRWGLRHRANRKERLEPTQLGAATNWTATAGRCAARDDGTLWRWGNHPVQGMNAWTDVWADQPELWLRLPEGRKAKSLCMAWGTLSLLADNGTLWMATEYDEGSAGKPLPIGDDDDWREASVIGNCFVAAVKTNGEMWVVSGGRVSPRITTIKRPLSEYPVWLSAGWGGVVNGQPRSILALAKDGMLCRYFISEGEGWGDWPEHFWVSADELMAPTRLKAIKVADLRADK